MISPLAKKIVGRLAVVVASSSSVKAKAKAKATTIADTEKRPPRFCLKISIMNISVDGCI
jgi:hypothetical protein